MSSTPQNCARHTVRGTEHTSCRRSSVAERKGPHFGQMDMMMDVVGGLFLGGAGEKANVDEREHANAR